MTNRVRLDWVASPARVAVNSSELSGRSVFHYSIPVMEKTGDGAYEHGSAIESGKLLLHGGEVLISKLNPRKSRVVIAAAHEVPTVCSSEFVVLRPNPDLSTRFLYWLLSSSETTQALSAQVRSATRSHQRVEPSAVTKMWIALPSLAEQQRIARFLDIECGLLDEVIAEQERLVAQLSERRLALISRAVTGGLQVAHGEGSGTDEWFGSLPEGWRSSRLKHLGRAIIGLTYGPGDVQQEGEGTLVLRAGNIQNDAIDLTTGQVWVGSRIDDRLRLAAGDILICARNGSARLIGKSAVIPAELAGQTWGAFMLVFRSAMNPFISWVLRSTIFSQQAGLFATSTINQLTVNTINNMRIPVPPISEQIKVDRFLQTETERMELLSAEAKRQIDLCRERRDALITAAVTGKMKVA